MFPIEEEGVIVAVGDVVVITVLDSVKGVMDEGTDGLPTMSIVVVGEGMSVVVGNAVCTSVRLKDS